MSKDSAYCPKTLDEAYKLAMNVKRKVNNIIEKNKNPLGERSLDSNHLTDQLSTFQSFNKNFTGSDIVMGGPTPWGASIPQEVSILVGSKKRFYIIKFWIFFIKIYYFQNVRIHLLCKFYALVYIYAYHHP